MHTQTQARAVALKAKDEQDSTFNYKEWACEIGGPEPWEDNASPLTSRINTGVTFFRSTVGGIAMAVRWIKSLVVGSIKQVYSPRILFMLFATVWDSI